ncbi:hypothetical protein [Desulfovibrio cuneatus]|uniref:hypothetical protein n=1 Tax=Desulfovibrio cuneatus TaxID=159728 RepID=UPI0004165621|nr:hypothetical protein [Desulfovibrio cuneatus]
MKKTDEALEKQYERVFAQATGGNPVFPLFAKEQMAKMVEEILTTNNAAGPVLSTNQSYFIKGGNMAEEFHAHSFNLDAILKDSDTRAFTDRRADWYEHEWNGQLLGKNANPDVIVSTNGKVTQSAQLKYNKDAASTAGQMSQVKDNTVKYENNDTFIGPSEQVGGIKQQSLNNIQKNTERNGNPVQREAYQQTHDKISGTLKDGDVSSRPLTKQEANELGKGNTKQLEKVQNEFQTRSTFQQMGKAATGAAAMSAVVCGAVNITRYMRQVNCGEISSDEAVCKIVTETVCSAADSAVKAGANVGVQSLMVRYGAEKVVINALAKQGMGAMMRTGAITAGVVCAVDAVKDLVALGSGKLTADEFYERQGKNVLNTSAGVMGGGLGFTAASSLAASWGVTGLAGNALMLTGGLAGGLIAGLAMTLAIENGIEKPYRELVQNTRNLQDSAKVLEQVSQAMFMGQVCFTKFVEQNWQLEKQFQAQMAQVDRAGTDALTAIMKI